MKVILPPPDLAAFGGDTGMPPFVRTFDTGRPGPHVVINALMHGNEYAGMHALIRLVRYGPQPRRGRLTLTLANVAAFESFEPSSPLRARYLDTDMNRLWSPALWEDQARSREHARARALWPIFAQADYLLDLHTMSTASPPLILCGPTTKGRRLAMALGVPANVVADQGHRSGPRLIDCPPFGDEHSRPVAILLEAGRHFDRTAIEVSYRTCVRLLQVAGSIEAEPAGQTAKPRLFEVTHAIVVEHAPFSFARRFRGLERVPLRGTIIAIDGDRPVRTPYDDCRLVMPNPRARPGQTGIRLARRLALPEDATGLRPPWP